MKLPGMAAHLHTCMTALVTHMTYVINQVGAMCYYLKALCCTDRTRHENTSEYL